ncbi:helix-turn-helix domain-containing protein [uncultured Gulosibacter sp.]|uniref:PucR family transcriptional regulator n=1 Tax=uncultured Gulosibacter sp. TaxID=1339167 RepID=UPI00288A7943|nr:helix-turn-helix domain-containing protein [uncultured Gulosibacter sp.]
MPAALSLDWLHETLSHLPDRHQLPSVLQRISQRTGTSVVLFNAVGEMRAAVGHAPARLIWESLLPHLHDELLSSSGTDLRLRVGRWQLHPIITGSHAAAHVLVLAALDDRAIDDATRLIASTAITAVLAALHGLDSARIRERAELLSTLGQGIARDRESRFWPRLVEFGFVAYAPFMLVVGAPSSPQADAARAVHEHITRVGGSEFGVLFANHLVSAASDEEFHALLADTPDAQAWLEELGRNHFLGVSATHSALTDVPRALREAELAQRVAADFGVARHESLDSEAAAHHPVHYSRLPLRQWIAAEAGRGELTARRRRILRAFDNQAELLHTLVVYLASDMEVSTAADHLYVHPNTVRYRLSRVERALDVSLRSPQAVTDLMLCLEPRVAAMQLLLDQE